MSGPDRIIQTPSGDWCDECHRDAKDPFDNDQDLYVVKRKLDGTCICCGAVIVDGNYS